MYQKKQQLESIVEHKEGRKEGRESLSGESQVRVSIYQIGRLTFVFVTVAAAIGHEFGVLWGREREREGEWEGGEEGERGRWLAFFHV